MPIRSVIFFFFEGVNDCGVNKCGDNEGDAVDSSQSNAEDLVECDVNECSEDAVGSSQSNAEDLVKVKEQGAIGGSISTVNGGQIKIRAAEKRADACGDSKREECTRADCLDIKRKYKALQKNYAKLAIENAEVTLKHKHLSKTIANINENDTECADDSKITTDGLFLDSELETLNRLSAAKRYDSTFIRSTLEFLYQEDFSILRNKSVHGTIDTNFSNSKKPLTPAKVKRIKELFVDRLCKCRLDPATFEERSKESRINQLLATGIKNIVNKIKDVSMSSVIN